MLNFRTPVMRIKALFSIGICLFFIFSCQPTVDSQKVVEIDGQISEVEATLYAFQEIDTADVYEKFNNLIGNVQYIQKFQMDTMHLKTAQFISRYYGLARLIEDFNNYAEIEEQILISKKQFENLKHDYINNILDDKEFNEFFAVERNDFFLLQEQVGEMISNWEKFQEKLPEYNPKVDSIVHSIKTKRNSLRL